MITASYYTFDLFDYCEENRTSKNEIFIFCVLDILMGLGWIIAATQTTPIGGKIFLATIGVVDIVFPIVNVIVHLTQRSLSSTRFANDFSTPEVLHRHSSAPQD